MMSRDVIHGLENVPASLHGYVLTIGNFDGVHLGHQRILATGRQLADAGQLLLVAMTFEPPPDLVIRPMDLPQRLTCVEQKVELLQGAGADVVVVATADMAMLGMDPASFINYVILDRFAPSHVVEGPNFFFGHRRSGTIDTLRQAGPAAGFEVHEVQPLALDFSDGPQQISSTLIRRMVMAGQVEQAAECLGRPFMLIGTVVTGEGRGRELEFPTVNLGPGDYVMPGDGVYVGRACIGGERCAAAVSVGAKPTFHPEGDRCIEANLLDVKQRHNYDELLRLELVARLRDQVRFDDPESLRAQIAKDVDCVREYWREHS
ncbi:MAG: riboflavin biosynthesis protein RibF [Planctomycetota bacterium]|jgi:riboflavin kinase/FMN adenylyltransferase